MSASPTTINQKPSRWNDAWSALAFVVSLVIAFSQSLANIFPTLDRLGAGDELTYINNGRLLLEGTLPPFAWGPSVSAFYAVLYLPFRFADTWLLEVTWLGHVILFLSLFVMVVLVARRFLPKTNGLFAVFVLAIGSMALMTLIRNSSDAMFALFSGLMFWQFLGWVKTRKARTLITASIFWTVAAFARNDGWVLLVLALVWLAVDSRLRREGDRRLLLRSIGAFLLPATVIVSIVFLIYSQAEPDFLGTVGTRAYGAFEHAQGVVYGDGQYLDDSTDRQMTSLIYGTPDENGFSVARAILHNPSAFLDRMVQSAKHLPGQILDAYGGAVTVIFLFLALAGMTRLIRDRRMDVITLIAIGLLGLPVYFLTFFRAGYLALPIGAVFLLMAVGLQEVFQREESGVFRGELAVLVFFLSLGLYGIFAEKTSWTKIGFCASGFMAGLLLARKYHLAEKWKYLITIGTLGILLAPMNLPERLMPARGGTPQEQTARWLAERYPPETLLVEYRPQIAALAKMRYLEFPDLGSDGDYADWLDDQGVDLVLMEPLRVDVPYVDALIRSSQCLQQIFGSPESGIKVWSVAHPCAEQTEPPK
jgi:4-amino-4-deoxy-L-arabinose transferase-like glycosyltransferase